MLKSAPSVTVSSTLLTTAFPGSLVRLASTSFTLPVCTSGSQPHTNQLAHCVSLLSDLVSSQGHSNISRRVEAGMKLLWGTKYPCYLEIFKRIT